MGDSTNESSAERLRRLHALQKKDENLLSQDLSDFGDFLKDQYNQTVQAAKNIYDNPSIVLENGAQMSKEAGAFLKDQYNQTVQAAKNIANDPSIVGQNLDRLGTDVANKLAADGSKFGQVISDVYNEKMGPYAALREIGPMTAGYAGTAAGVAGLAKGVAGKAATLAKKQLKVPKKERRKVKKKKKKPKKGATVTESKGGSGPSTAVGEGETAGTGRNANQAKGADSASSTAPEAGKSSGPASDAPTNGSPAPAGEPMDLITGKVFVEQEDFTPPWRVPFAWKRCYWSDSRRWGTIGVGWESPADFRLSINDKNGVRLWFGKPGALVFPKLPALGERLLQPNEGAVLERTPDALLAHTKTGLVYSFHGPSTGNHELPLQSIRDPNGNRIDFVRRDGVLAEIRSSCGPWLELKNRGGLIKEIVLHHPTQPDRLLVRYDHSPTRNLTAVFDPLGVPHTFAYHNHCLVKHTDRNGVTFHYQYDSETAEGRCTRTWGDNGLFDTHIEYDLPNRCVRSTDSCGQVTLIEFDEQRRLTRRANPFGEATTYEYDSAGRTSAVTDPIGRRTAYRYDDTGNLLELTRPDGATLRWQYDARHCAVLFTDAGGHPWRQEFDERRRLLRQISPLGTVREYRYNDLGDLLEYINPRLAVTRFQSDPHGTSLLAVTDALDHSSTWQVDSLGNVLSATDPAGAVTCFEYDAKSRLARVLKPSGSEIRCAYDGELNLTRYVDELGHATRFEYGYVNRLVARHLPNGTTVRYDYDTENRLVGVINGRGERYNLQRDPAGRIIHEVDYWGRLTAYGYDPAGQLADSVDPLGRRTTFDRDPLGRLTAHHFADGSLERFTYDSAGNLVATESPHGKVQRTFDPEGRLMAETQGEFSVEFGYDSVGNMVRRSSTAGNEVAYDYDPVNRLAAIRVNGQTVLEVNRDARGLPVRERLGPNLWRYSEFDSEYRVTRQHTSVGEGRITDRRYEYDRAGNLLQRQDAVKGTNAFAYDPIGNLIRHTDPEGRIKQFLRDAAGDFLQPVALESSETPQSASSTALGHKNQSEEAPNPQATRGNEILPSDSRRTDPPPFGLPRTPIPGRESYGQPIRAAQFGDLHYRYDAAGNVIERRTKHRKTRFEWDCANRLIRGRGADGIPVYMGYDAMGRRLSKTLKGHRITFGWDGEALMAEHGDHGWREYIMQPGGFTPVALIEGGQVFHFETDQVGLPYELLNCDGDVVWSADYDAWGGITRLAKERVKNPLRLQGQYADDELGIAYNSFRYFDSLSGGFISKDPLGLTAGENLFSFGPQALTWIDPLGLAGDPANATHITYEGIKKGKPYVGYASKPGLGHSADDVLKYRYPNTYKFDVAPTPIYVGDGQIGKNTARGLEQRVFEEKGGLQGTSNKRNPVGVGNPNRDDYLSAADEHRKKLGTTC